MDRLLLADFDFADWVAQTEREIELFELGLRARKPLYGVGDRVELAQDLYRVRSCQVEPRVGYWLDLEAGLGPAELFVPLDFEIYLFPASGSSVEPAGPSLSQN